MEAGILGFPRKILPLEYNNVFLFKAPDASSALGVLNLGETFITTPGTGKFSGNSSGTYLAIGAPSGFGGDVIDCEVGGSQRFVVNNTFTKIAGVLLAVNSNGSFNANSVGGLQNVNVGVTTDSTTAGIAAFGAAGPNGGQVYLGGTGLPSSTGVGAATATIIANANLIPFAILQASTQNTNLAECWTSVQRQMSCIDASGFYRVSLVGATQTGNPSLSSGGSLTASTQYFFAVSSLDPFGFESLPGTTTTVTTDLTNKTAVVTWTAVPGAMSYNVYRSTVNFNSNMTTGNTTRFSVGNVTTYSDIGTGGSGVVPPTMNINAKPAKAAGACLASGATTPSYFAQTQTVSANYGQVNIGSGPFDGSTSGKFAGSASGTILAINTTSGFLGNILDLEVAGSNKLKLDISGNLTIAGGLAFAPATTLTAPSAGAAGALPATPAGYATVTIGGSARQIAFY